VKANILRKKQRLEVSEKRVLMIRFVLERRPSDKRNKKIV
jgi:hypothetical protein